MTKVVGSEQMVGEADDGGGVICAVVCDVEMSSTERNVMEVSCRRRVLSASVRVVLRDVKPTALMIFIEGLVHEMQSRELIRRSIPRKGFLSKKIWNRQSLLVTIFC